MTRAMLIKWALAAMTSAQPPAVTPWADTYSNTAEVFVKVAEEHPLFKGDDGVQRTVSWFVSTAWFEGRFDPHAKGDCTKKTQDGKCADITTAQSFCMFQVEKSNFKQLGVTEEQILGSTETCTLAGRQMMSISIGICKGRPMEDWLGQYAFGHDLCGGPKGEGLKESRHRVMKAKWLFANVKTPE